MDYDYYDDSRTRFQVQPTSSFSAASAPPHEKKHQASRLEVGLCLSFSVLLFGLAWKTDQDLLQFLLVWISLAMLVGPFAPSSATGGMCQVGLGEAVPSVDETDSGDLADQHASKNPKNHRKLSRNGDSAPVPKDDSPGKSDGNGKDGRIPDAAADAAADDGGGRGHSDEEDDDDDGNGELDEYLEFWNGEDERSKDGSKRKPGDKEEEEAKEACPPEWTPQDLDMLKKLMVKFPRGKLQRWEAIAEAFNGKHTVESIVKMSKRAGERAKGDEDSYMQFLARRKGSAKTIDSPLTQRCEEEEHGAVGPSPASLDSNGLSVKEGAMEPRDASAVARAGSGGTKKEKKKEWSETEDRALLNALKAFPKDTPMRWEKVAMAVPGRTKQQCFHHYAELRDGFRNKHLIVSGED